MLLQSLLNPKHFRYLNFKIFSNHGRLLVIFCNDFALQKNVYQKPSKMNTGRAKIQIIWGRNNKALDKKSQKE